MACGMSNLSANQIRYQPPVRLGNWYEALLMDEADKRKFKESFDRKELFAAKARIIYDRLVKEIVLEAPTKFLRFGAIMQILPISVHLNDHDCSDLHTALSVTPKSQVIRRGDNINENYDVMVSRSINPNVRSSFRIVNSDDTNGTDELVKYGQHFRIECVEHTNDPTWVFSGPKLANLSETVHADFVAKSNGEENCSVGLVRRCNCGPGQDIPIAFADWFCMHVEPGRRIESEGTYVPCNTPVVIVHSSTRRNLAVEHVVCQTMFGPELLVSVQNYLNVQRREIWKNLWTINNGQRSTIKK